VATGVLLGLAAGVKVWPLLLAPVLGRVLPRGAVVPAGLALAVSSAVVLVPLLATAWAGDAGLVAYARAWVAGNAPFAWALALLGGEAEPGLRLALGLAGAGVALAVAVRAPGGEVVTAGRVLVVAAAVFYLSPTQFPWYVVWFMPFATLLGCRALLLPAALVPVYWLSGPLRVAGYEAVFALLAVVAVVVWGRWRT
jgi:hypothetical protein